MLVVMAMILLLHALVLHAWFVVGLHHESAYQRRIWQHNFYATEAIFDASLLLIQHHFDALYKKVSAVDVITTFDMSRLLHYWVPSMAHRSLIVSVGGARDKKQTNALVCGARLYEGSIPICSLHCMLAKVPGVTTIREEKHFVVSYWTFSVDV